MLFKPKYMLQNMASEPSERTPRLAQLSARWVAPWASERANPLARSAREFKIFGSARLVLARSLGSASRLGSLPTLPDCIDLVSYLPSLLKTKKVLAFFKGHRSIQLVMST